METLCIVSCGKAKIWDKHPQKRSVKAKDVYIGTFAKKCIEYAENFYPESWIILSAKHGFIEPDEVIHNSYDVCFHDDNSNNISIIELKKQILEKDLEKYDNIIVLGGKYYSSMVGKVFSQKIYNPLGDCKGIGYMMAKLNELINK